MNYKLLGPLPGDCRDWQCHCGTATATGTGTVTGPGPAAALPVPVAVITPARRRVFKFKLRARRGQCHGPRRSVGGRKLNGIRRRLGVWQCHCHWHRRDSGWPGGARRRHSQ